jgi:hypothetical protein
VPMSAIAWVEGRVKSALRVAYAVKRRPRYLGQTLFPDTPSGARAYTTLLKMLHPLRLLESRNFAKKLPAPPARLEPREGYLRLDWSKSKVVTDCIEYCRGIARSRDLANVASKKEFLRAVDLDQNAGVVRALRDYPPLQAIMADYLDAKPVLRNCQLWYSPNTVFEKGKSQEYHLDGDTDLRQVKVFIAVEEVTPDHGPFTVIPAVESDKIWAKLKNERLAQKRNDKFSDEVIYARTAMRGEEVTGPPGTTLFVDTYNCYHFGSRPAKNPRLVIYMHFTSPFSRETPIWGSSAPAEGAY